MRPWGDIDWLLPRVGARNWRGIVCASFEDRCTAVPEWLSRIPSKERHYLLKISDPPNRFQAEVERLTENNLNVIVSHLKASAELRSEDLLAEPSVWDRLVREACKPGASILLDVSTLPKRIFLFLVKRMTAIESVKDIVVCYTRSEKYREGALTEDAEPPAALPGFARVSGNQAESTLIVGVGYMAFNLGELLEQSRGKALKFLFPFPPASPGFRRNWRLLHELAPDLPIQTEIRRIHALDLFAALEWLKAVGRDSSGPIDMVPLGPKPHALAMALAHAAIGDRAELLYSQPHAYAPGYSSGIGRKADGRADIHAYCLRRDYRNFY